MEKTSTISVRVPVEFKAELKAYTLSQGITMSKYLQDTFLYIDPETSMPLVQQAEIDDSTMRMLTSFGGGTLITIFVYKLLVTNLPIKFPKMTEQEVKMTALISSISSGLLGQWGIKNLFSGKQADQ